MRPQRLHALDATRGVLALVVVAGHVCLPFGSAFLTPCRLLAPLGLLSVLMFFLMSGFVLARAYDGRPLSFMVRRVVRLWPLYALCIVIGHMLRGSFLPWPELVWAPGYFPWVDTPAWSLCYEAWMTPVFPVFFALARANRWAAVAVSLGLFVLACAKVSLGLVSAAPMVLGVALAQFRLRFPTKVPPATLWLGKLSFSLYLTHQLVLTGAEGLCGPWGAVLALPAILPVAWAAWWAVERPSIAVSRAVGSFRYGAVASVTLDPNRRRVVLLTCKDGRIPTAGSSDRREERQAVLF